MLKSEILYQMKHKKIYSNFKTSHRKNTITKELLNFLVPNNLFVVAFITFDRFTFSREVR